VKRILAGRQCMTVYEPIAREARVAALFTAAIGRGVGELTPAYERFCSQASQSGSG
jgi:ABC-type xylose transport system substrate-binding protein